jgi:hypothetical protein
MNWGREQAPQRIAVALEIGCVIVGLVASFIPVLPRTRPVWGCHRAWSSVAPNQIVIADVLPDSPASAAGLANGDVVLAIDGRPIDTADRWDRMTVQLRIGQEAELLVKRGGQELTRVVRGEEPRWEAMMYYHWQLAYAGGCAVILVFLVASRSVRARASVRLPILLIVAGLGAAWALLLTDWQWSFILLQWRRPVDVQPHAWLQAVVCLSAAMFVVVLAAGQINRIFASNRRRLQSIAAGA